MHQTFPQAFLRRAVLVATAAATLCLSGCAGLSGTAAPTPTTLITTIPAGSVHGGQQPVQGAHVFVFAAGSTGYGSASIPMLTAGTLDTTPGSLTNGDFYVTTDANGNFSYGGLTVSCPSPASQIYLLATGGNQTTAPANTAIAMTAAIGRCDSINTSTVTNIDEVTTVAMTTALNAFMLDGAHVGAPSTNTGGLVNAFRSINNLVDSSYGTARVTTPGGNGVAPQATLNTLANIIAACVNSNTPTSTACTSLFTATTPASAVVPTNVLTAALNIAASPAANVATLYGLAASTPPFQPALTSQPNDFSLGITYSSIIPPGQLGATAIDGSGNVWIVSCQSCVSPSPANAIDVLIRYNPDGTLGGAFGAGILHFIQGIAIDTAGNVWTTNQATSAHPQDEVIELFTSGATGTPITNIDFGTNSINQIAFDKQGSIWLSTVDGLYDFGGGLTQVGGQMLAMTTSGTILAAMNEGNYFNSNLSGSGPSAVAVDNANNIWVLGTGNSSLMKFSDSGTPAYVTKYNPTGFSSPLSLAINSSNELWITESNNTLSHILGATGANASGSPLTNASLFTAPSVTTDGSGQVIIPNCRVDCAGSGSTAPDNLLRLSATGSPNTGGTGGNYGAQVAGLSNPVSAASDASGAVWVANKTTGTVTQVIGFATPTIVPLSSAVAASKVGIKP